MRTETSASPAATCVSGQQVYLLATGGGPGSGTVNAAVGLMAILGRCPVTGSMSTVTPCVILNEASTVAAAYAFAGYATDSKHVANSGTPLAPVGIANAFAAASNLESITSSQSGLATAPARP